VSAALSIGEFGATSFLSRQESQTLPVVLAQVLGRPGDIVQAAGFALSLVMALFVAVVVARA
jgi:thiamine transport system permease protein